MFIMQLVKGGSFAFTQFPENTTTSCILVVCFANLARTPLLRARATKD